MVQSDNRALVAEIYAKKFLINFDNIGEDEMKMVDMSYDKQLTDGNTLRLPKMGSIVLNNGVTITHSSPNITDIEIVVDQFYNWSIPIPKIDKKQIKGIALEKMWKGRADQAEVDVRGNTILGLYSGAGLSVSQTALTKNNVLDWLADINRALYDGKAINSAGKSRVNGAYPYVMLNGAICNLIDKAPNLDKATEYGDVVLKEGVAKVKLIKGLQVLKSTRFTATNGTYQVMAGIPEAIAYVSQIKEARVIETEKDWNDYLQGMIGFLASVVNADGLCNAPVTIA